MTCVLLFHTDSCTNTCKCISSMYAIVTVVIKNKQITTSKNDYLYSQCGSMCVISVLMTTAAYFFFAYIIHMISLAWHNYG